jgi:hypothetical protein
MTKYPRISIPDDLAKFVEDKSLDLSKFVQKKLRELQEGREDPH